MIGCDVGSQGTNGALYAADGTLVSSAYEAYDLSFPHPSWAEQDPDVWMGAVERVCRRLVDACPDGADGIGGLSFGSQLDGMVACDAAGRPVRPAMIWMDRRAEPRRRGSPSGCRPADFYAAVGANLDSSHAVFKALWIRDEEPASWERVVHPDAARLVRVPPRDRRAPRRLLERLLARAARPADADLVGPRLEAAGIDPAMLPALAAGTARSGLTPAFAEASGLRAEHRRRRRVRRRDGGDARRRGVRARARCATWSGTAEPVCAA